MRASVRPLLLAVALLLGCGETTTSHFCTYHSDCPEEGPRFCINGICHAEQCQEARDCGPGEACVEGACTEG
jgi:hypothetical protein